MLIARQHGITGQGGIAERGAKGRGADGFVKGRGGGAYGEMRARRDEVVDEREERIGVVGDGVEGTGLRLVVGRGESPEEGDDDEQRQDFPEKVHKEDDAVGVPFVAGGDGEGSNSRHAEEVVDGAAAAAEEDDRAQPQDLHGRARGARREQKRHARVPPQDHEHAPPVDRQSDHQQQEDGACEDGPGTERNHLQSKGVLGSRGWRNRSI